MSTQAADLDEFLAPGRFVDSDSPLVRAFTAEVVGTATDPVEIGRASCRERV